MKVINIANKFIDIYNKKNKDLSHKKLQKLVYLAYGFYLVLENKKLFNEKIEAWNHGPGCRDLYYEIKKVNIDSYCIKTIINNESDVDMTEELEKVSVYIEKNFGHYEADALEKITHLPSSAWYKVQQNNEDQIELQDSDIRSEIMFLINKGNKRE